MTTFKRFISAFLSCAILVSSIKVADLEGGIKPLKTSFEAGFVSQAVVQPLLVFSPIQSPHFKAWLFRLNAATLYLSQKSSRRRLLLNWVRPLFYTFIAGATAAWLHRWGVSSHSPSVWSDHFPLLAGIIGPPLSRSPNKEPNEWVRPLDSISDVQNIFVYSPFIGEPKLGEAVINLWPLVTGLMLRYPQSRIYVATPFVDMFRAAEFHGRVYPVPRTPKEVKSWSLLEADWRELTLDQLAGKTEVNHQRRHLFIETHRIDMVFDVANSPSSPRNFDSIIGNISHRPYLIKLYGPSSVADFPAIVVDRLGRQHSVTDVKEKLGQLTINKNLDTAGIWRFSIGIYALLGLSVSIENLLELRLSLEEAVDAITLLSQWSRRDAMGVRHDGFLDLKKRIIVINVYAVSQKYFLSVEDWVAGIVKAIEEVPNCYFLFTHGGPMDQETNFVEQIIDQVRLHFSDREVPIVLPRRSIYPVINIILGIASGLISLDTGLAHYANGMFGLPTADIIHPDKQHWMLPRKNALGVLMPYRSETSRYGGILSDQQFEQSRRERLATIISSFVSDIVQSPDRPAAIAAKTVAASFASWSRMNDLLITSPLIRPTVIDSIREVLVQVMSAFDLLHSLIPEILIVDSTVHKDVGPRFSAQLIARSKLNHPILLVDTRNIVDASDGPYMKEEAMQLTIPHQVVGHGLARQLFEDFKVAHENIAESLSHNGDEILLGLMLQEEILAWLILLTAYHRLFRPKGIVTLNQSIVQRILNKFGIHIARFNWSGYLSGVLKLVAEGFDGAELESFRFRAALKDPSFKEHVVAEVTRKFWEVIAPKFGIKRTASDPALQLAA